MTEFDWRNTAYARFNSWAEAALLESRCPASVLTYSGTVDVIDSSGGATTYSGSFSYDDASQGWFNLCTNGQSWAGSLASSANVHVNDCAASLATWSLGGSITVTCVSMGSPSYVENILTSGSTAAANAYTLEDGFNSGVIGFTTLNGPYTSTATDPAMNAVDALAHAKAMVTYNGIAANRLKSIAQDIGSSSVPGVETLKWMYYQGELRGLEVAVKDNISKLADLHARFPGTVK